MPRLNSKLLFLVGALMLILAVLLQVVRYKPQAREGRGLPLEQLLPAEIARWTSRVVPLGATEVSEGKVEEILKFDDVFSREYRSEGRSLGLYVAYWKPGKMPTQVVASHTPDRCWSSAGWHCDEQKHAVSLPGLRPGEWRIFSMADGPKLKVIFWVLVGDELYDFGDRFTRIPSPWRWWRDVAKQIFRAPPEQYFIRLTSNVPFEQLKDDPGYQGLLAALAKLGLAGGSDHGE